MMVLFETPKPGARGNDVVLPFETPARRFTPYDKCIDIYGMTNNAVQYGNRIYLIVQGANRDPYAILYDGMKWSAPVKIGTTPLPLDGHGFPSILRSDDGYLHVMYGSHDENPFMYATSTNPDDISAWTDTTSKIGIQTGTYPFLFKNPADGTLFWFFREFDNHLHDYRISTDNGATWGAPILWYTEWGSWWNEGFLPYIVYNQPYLREVGGHWCIIFHWNIYVCADSIIENVYYVRFDMVDKHFYSIDGTDLGTSLTTTEADTNCKIFNSAGKKCYFGTTVVGPDGMILCVYNWEYSTGLYRFESMEWNGSSWVDNKVITISIRAQWMYGALFENGTKANFLVTPDDTDVERWEYDWTAKTWTQLTDFALETQCPHYAQGNYWSACMLQVTDNKMFVFMENGVAPFSVAVGIIDDYGELKILSDVGISRVVATPFETPKAGARF